MKSVVLAASLLGLFACTGSTPAGSSGSSSGATAGGSASSSASSSGSGSGSSSSSSSSGSSGSSGTSGDLPDGGMLRFAFTGDTRPDNCDDVANYPTTVFTQIVAGMKGQNVRFALDTGDHLKSCGSDSNHDASKTAASQLALYTGATDTLGAPFYLTMGNHECHDNSALCDVTNPVLSTFMLSVQREVNTAQPYYSFDVNTPLGVATFVFVADTAWNDAEETWLEDALTHGDASTYTIIAKHVPTSNLTDFATNAAEVTVIERHRFSLLLDSHQHTYLHAGEAGREVTLGLGGAPLDDPASGYGYGLAEQQPDGTFKISVFDSVTNVARDTFSVGPN